MEELGLPDIPLDLSKKCREKKHLSKSDVVLITHRPIMQRTSVQHEGKTVNGKQKPWTVPKPFSPDGPKESTAVQHGGRTINSMQEPVNTPKPISLDNPKENTSLPPEVQHKGAVISNNQEPGDTPKLISSGSPKECTSLQSNTQKVGEVISTVKEAGNTAKPVSPDSPKESTSVQPDAEHEREVISSKQEPRNILKPVSHDNPLYSMSMHSSAQSGGKAVNSDLKPKNTPEPVSSINPVDSISVLSSVQLGGKTINSVLEPKHTFKPVSSNSPMDSTSAHPSVQHGGKAINILQKPENISKPASLDISFKSISMQPNTQQEGEAVNNMQKSGNTAGTSLVPKHFESSVEIVESDDELILTFSEEDVAAAFAADSACSAVNSVDKSAAMLNKSAPNDNSADKSAAMLNKSAPNDNSADKSAVMLNKSAPNDNSADKSAVMLNKSAPNDNSACALQNIVDKVLKDLELSSLQNPVLQQQAGVGDLHLPSKRKKIKNAKKGCPKSVCDSQQHLVPVKKNGIPKSACDSPQYLVPMKEHGWRREVVIRGITFSGSSRSDVYYYSPNGKKLRSNVEVCHYLAKTNETSLSGDNFTFAQRPISEMPWEAVRHAGVSTKMKWIPSSIKTVQHPKSVRKNKSSTLELTRPVKEFPLETKPLVSLPESVRQCGSLGQNIVNPVDGDTSLNVGQDSKSFKSLRKRKSSLIAPFLIYPVCFSDSSDECLSDEDNDYAYHPTNTKLRKKVKGHRKRGKKVKGKSLDNCLDSDVLAISLPPPEVVIERAEDYAVLGEGFFNNENTVIKSEEQSPMTDMLAPGKIKQEQNHEYRNKVNGSSADLQPLQFTNVPVHKKPTARKSTTPRLILKQSR